MMASLAAAGATLAGTALLTLERVAAQQPSQAYSLVDVWDSYDGLFPPGVLRRPNGIASDDNGTVYVVDSARSQVHLLRGGSFVPTWGRRGSAPGELLDPHGIDVLGNRVFVADTGNARVQVFDSSGRFVATWPGLGRPWGVAAGTDGLIYVSDQGANRIFQFDAAGNRLNTYGRPGVGPGELQAPQGLDVWPDGRMAIADSGNGRVQIWAPDGTFSQVITVSADLPPMDVAIVDDATIVVAEPRRAATYDVLSGQRTGGAVALRTGGGIVVEQTAERAMWVTVQHDFQYSNGVVGYSNPSFANPIEILDLPGPASEFVHPRRISAGPDGLYLLDAWPRVQRISYSGVAQGHTRLVGLSDIEPVSGGQFVATGATVERRDGTQFIWSWAPVTGTTWLGGLAYDGRNAQLYVADLRYQAIHRLSQSGSLVDSWPFAVGAYQSITDMAVAADGRVLLLNRTQGRVEARSPSGQLLATWPVQGVPIRLAADGAGNAFVLTREGWVWKLAGNGRVLAWWDAGDAGPGSRAVPADLAAGPDGRVYVADSRGNRVLVFAHDPLGAPRPPPSQGGCTFTRDKIAAPARIQLGETVNVTLTLNGECLEEGRGADIVLVLDRSGSMAGQKIAAARAAAVAFVGEIDFAVSRVGLVVFHTEATKPLTLTNDAPAMIRALLEFGVPAGGTDIGEGVQLATEELATNGRPGVERIIVLMTDGRPEGAGLVDADQAAQAAKDAGIRLFSVGFGPDVDPGLLRRMASTPDDYNFAPSEAELAQIYIEIARRIAGGLIIQTGVITDVVPTNMEYVTGSAAPPATFANRTLTWQLDRLRAGMRLTYRLRPQEAGLWPTNVEARARYTDGLGQPGELIFPIPRVLVVRPPGPIYLPVAFKTDCLVRERHADVAVVLDTSSSMTGAKLEAAKDAAHRFVDLLDLAHDQAAIIAFNREAQTVVELTGQASRLHAAINGLSIMQGTAIDAGLRAATAELSSARHRVRNNRVIVLLTDGQNNAGPDPVIAAATDAKARGIIVYTVALGSDADRDLMRRVATDPSRAFYAPSQNDLRRIYEGIAGVIPCE
jgi:Mg-chelatase subunit ChlD/sugar lactone lactonase YvrE